MVKQTSRLLRMFTALAVWASLCAGAQLEVEEPPGPGGGFPEPHIVTQNVFSFTATDGFPPCSIGAATLEFCHFLNQSAEDWDILEIRIAPGTERVACILLFGYDRCEARQGTNTSPSVLTFSGGTGIPRGEVLALTGTGWTSDVTFTIGANLPMAIPEPAPAALVLFGIGAAIAFRRRRRAQ